MKTKTQEGNLQFGIHLNIQRRSMPNPKETVNQTARRIKTNFKLDFQYSLLLELFFFNFSKNFFNVQKTI